MSNNRIIVIVLVAVPLVFFVYSTWYALTPGRTTGVAETVADIPYFSNMFLSLDCENTIEYSVWENRLRGKTMLLSGRINEEEFDRFFSEQNGWRKYFAEGSEDSWNRELKLFGLNIGDYGIDMSETDFYFVKDNSDERIVRLSSIYNKKHNTFLIIVDDYFE